MYIYELDNTLIWLDLIKYKVLFSTCFSPSESIDVLFTYVPFWTVLKSLLLCQGSSHTTMFSCGESVSKLFCNETSGSNIVKVKHMVFPGFWSGLSSNTAKVVLRDSKTELGYYWLFDRSKPNTHVRVLWALKPFQILFLQTHQCQRILVAVKSLLGLHLLGRSYFLSSIFHKH